MALYFQYSLDGVQKQKVAVLDGLRIGRSQGELRIPDPKISSLHAEVQLQEGKCFLVDLGSSNKIKVAGQRKSRVEMTPGLTFVIGNTEISVLEEFLLTAESLELKTILKSWKLQDSPNSAELFKPRFRLVGVAGWLAGKNLDFVYGPRELGRDTWDVTIEDPEAPSLICRLTPGPTGPIMEALCTEITVNQVERSTHILNHGDILRFGNTVLRMETLP